MYEQLSELRGYSNIDILEKQPYYIKVIGAASRISHISTLLSQEFTADWDKIFKGKHILDIGCGSGEIYPTITGYSIWEPFFLRLLSLNGAICYGVYLHKGMECDKDLYTHIQADIIPYVLNGNFADLLLPYQTKFDIIHSNNFVGANSPSKLDNALARKGIYTDDFAIKLRKQTEELITPGGLIILD